MQAGELFREGDLTAALAAAKRTVKDKPDDQVARSLLVQLLCFSGDLDRADLHLDVLGDQNPDAATGVALFRQLLRGERCRQELFRDGRLPELLARPTEVMRLLLEAVVLMKDDAPSEALERIRAADEARPTLGGKCDGDAFDDFRDLGDLTSSIFEVLTSTGKYYWVAMESVERLELRSPSVPRDLLWREAHMVVKGGPDGEVFIPALYHGSAEGDDRARLGRVTEWSDDGGPAIGSGLRMLLVGDEARSVMEVGEIAFEPTSEVA